MPLWSETHGSRACIQLAVTPTLKSVRGTGWVARGSAYRLPPSLCRCALYSRCKIGGASVLHVQRNLARCVKYTVAPLSPCIWIFQQDLSLSRYPLAWVEIRRPLIRLLAIRDPVSIISLRLHRCPRGKNSCPRKRRF